MNELKIALLAAKMDPEWPKLTKNKSGRFDYADLEHMLSLFEPILGTYDLVINFEPEVRGEVEVMVTVLEHPKTGAKSRAESKIRASKDNAEWGGYCTYQRRYGIMAVLGIAASNDPDPDMGPITVEQLEILKKALSDCSPRSGTVFKEVLAFGKINRLEEIPYDGFEDALKFISDRKAK